MKPFIFSEKEILDWASAYYDSFLDNKDNQEAEIVDANIDVPQEVVEKAEKSLREKFEAVYKELAALSNNYVTENEKEMYANEKGRNENFYLTTATAVGAMAAFTTMGLSAGTGNFTEFMVGASCGLAALLSSFLGNFALEKRQRKLAEDAQNVGLTMVELDWVRKYEKIILKEAKERGITPRFGSWLKSRSSIELYYLYLETKMLHHKFLMQDKLEKESEVLARGVNEPLKKENEVEEK